VPPDVGTVVVGQQLAGRDDQPTIIIST